MTLCGSGSLSIKCSAGTNRSIAAEVDGNITGDKSLNTLSNSVSFSPPHCMREFYGYTAAASTICMCFNTSSTVVLSDTTTCYRAYTPISIVNQCSDTITTINFSAVGCIFGTGTVCVGWNINGGSFNNIIDCNGTNVSIGCNFSILNVDYNDNICICFNQNSSGTINTEIYFGSPFGTITSGTNQNFQVNSPTCWSHTL